MIQYSLGYFVFYCSDERKRQEKQHMKFIYEKNEINLERWKQSDIIHASPNKYMPTGQYDI